MPPPADREVHKGHLLRMIKATRILPHLRPLAQFSSRRCFSLRGQGPQTVILNYQEPPPLGKRTGRYINQPDKGDLVDEHVGMDTVMLDGRELNPAADLESMGFALISHSTACSDFTEDDVVADTYYGEMMEVVKKASGAARVYVFDHTVRKSGNTNLNAEAGSSAAPVPRVHCDYTADGAPRRLQVLGEEGIFSRLKDRELTTVEVDALADGRFAFINVWRSLDPVHPIMQKPLAVCDENSVPTEDKFLYELAFPDRTGENYSLRYNAEHKWYYYPEMTHDECMVFKVGIHTHICTL